MKKISAIVLTLALSGCALFDAYFMAGYDNQEYKMINKIRTMAQISAKECDQPIVIQTFYVQVSQASAEFKNFTQYIPRNPEAHKMATQLEELVVNNSKAYKPTSSPTFCKLQIQQIERSAEKIQTVLGKKPR